MGCESRPWLVGLRLLCTGVMRFLVPVLSVGVFVQHEFMVRGEGHDMTLEKFGVGGSGKRSQDRPESPKPVFALPNSVWTVSTVASTLLKAKGDVHRHVCIQAS